MPRQKLTELDQTYTGAGWPPSCPPQFLFLPTNFHPNMDIITIETLAGIVKALEGGSTNHQQFDQKGHVSSELRRQLEPEGIYKCDGKDRLPPLLSPARHWFWSCKSSALAEQVTAVAREKNKTREPVSGITPASMAKYKATFAKGEGRRLNFRCTKN